MTVTKAIDAKGRLNLGQKFANRHVIVEEVDATEVRIRLARVVPEREAWLLDNAPARESIQRGLEQARQQQFDDTPPNPADDRDLCDKLEDEG